MTEKEIDKIVNEKIEHSKKTIATILNTLEQEVVSLEWCCEQKKWDNMVTYDIKDACTTLGFTLATLTNWFDE